MGATCLARALVVAPAPAFADPPLWSPPALLTTCSGPAPPRAAFPQSNPYSRTGTGAIVWGGDPARCRASAGVSQPPGLGIAALGGDDRPRRATAVQGRSTGALLGPTGVSATCGGRIVIAAAGATAAGKRPDALLLEGKPGSSFGPALSLGGPATPIAVTRAYRGDVAVASVGSGGRVLLRLQPYNASAMRAPIALAAGARGVDAIADALDYRADAVVAWHQGPTIYAREWLQPGQLGPIQRLGSAGPSPQIQTLISDNGHAMVVWTDTLPRPSGDSETRILISVARHQHRFEPPSVVERFTNVAGFTPGDGVVRLARLSTETVALAWTGMSSGHYAVRVGPVSIDAVPSGRTVSHGLADALLSDFAPGPHGQVVAIWTTAPRVRSGGFDASRRAVWASVGHIARHFRARFGAPEQVAAGGANAANPSVTFDPSTNRAVAVWQSSARPPAVQFAIRPAGAVGHPRVAAGAAACPALAGHPFRRALAIAAGGVGAVLVVGGVGWWLLRRRRMS